MKKVIVIIILVTQISEFNAQNIFNSNDQSFIELEATYVVDVLNNFQGGINQSAAYLGMIDLSATVNSDNLGLWQNGSLYFHIENTHGNNPSADIIGDFQTVSNIENDAFTYLYQFWYQQIINKLSFTIGIHDLNSVFFASDLAGEYINSSFGIMPIASVNVPLSIFPKNSFGAILEYSTSDKFTLRAGIYDGDPASLDIDPSNTKNTFSKDGGTFSVIEGAFQNTNSLSGQYKLGTFYHSAELEVFNDTLETVSGKYGVYFIADQTIIERDEKGSINMFFQLGVAPKSSCFNSLYWCLGVNYNGILKSRPDDIFGLAVANAQISEDCVDLYNGNFSNYESAIECFYKYNISENFTFQPEFQYIINPGAQTNLNNSLVGLIRTYITF